MTEGPLPRNGSDVIDGTTGEGGAQAPPPPPAPQETARRAAW